MTEAIKATSESPHNVAFIRLSSSGDWRCVLSNGIPASLTFAGIRHGLEIEAEIAISECRTAGEAIEALGPFTYGRWSYEVASSKPDPIREAGPDMLAALKASAPWLAKFIADEHHLKCAMPKAATDALSAVNDAIAKAEGRTNG
jgi:hypothetical protein